MDDPDIRARASEAFTAYVGNHNVPPDQIPVVYNRILAALSGAVPDAAPAVVQEKEAPIPAVNPKKSVFPDHIICLNDGRKLKTLKRHLNKLGFTPESYRAHWGLPPDYPMVAPNYAATRSNLAKSLGLGRKAGERPAAEPKAIAAPAKPTAPAAPKQPQRLRGGKKTQTKSKAASK